MDLGPILICRIGREQPQQLCALPIAIVDETMRPQPVEPLDGLPPFVLGASVIRGTPIPVVDGRLLIEGVRSNASERDARLDAREARFVTLRVSGADGSERRVALLVDGVLGVRRARSDLTASLPPLLDRADGSVLATIGTLDSRLLVTLHTARLVPDEAFAQLEEQRS